MSWNLLELRRRSQRHWGRRLALVGAVVGVLLVTASIVGLPPLLRAQLRERLSGALGRPVEVERVTLNPLTGRVTVRGLAIAEPDGRPWVAWERLEVNLGLWSRVLGSWRLEEVRLTGFVGRIAVGPDGALNLADLLARRPPGGTDTRRASIAVDLLVVEGARLLLSDASRSPTFSSEIGPLSFTLSQFHSVGDPRAPYSFAAKTESGEGIEWRGSLSAGPFRSAGNFVLTGISLPKYHPYYASLLQGRVERGTATVRGAYSVVVDSAEPKLTLSDGAVEIRDLLLRGATPTPIELALPRLDASAIRADLAERSIAVGRVSATGGRALLHRGPSGIVLPWTSAPAPAARPGGSPPFRVTLDEVTLEDTDATLTDVTPPQPATLKIGKLALTLRHAASAGAAAPSPLEARFTLGGGGVAVSGSIGHSPGRADLRLEFHDVPLAPFGPYLESHTDLWLAKGQASGDLRLAFAGDGLEVSGEARVTDLGLVDNAADEEVLGWSSLSLSGVSVGTGPRRLHAAAVVLTDPVLRLSLRPDGGLNLAALRRPAPTPTATPPAGPRDWALSVDRVELANGRLDLADRSLPAAPRFSLGAVSGTATGLTTDPAAAPAVVRLEGRAGAAAPVALGGTLRPFGPAASMDLTLRAAGVDLSPIAPYVERHLGYTLERGSLGLEARLRLANRRIDAAPVATLERFTLGSRTESPEATRLPVALALALLTDREGRTVIDVPVQGSLDDPEFRVGRVIWRIVTNVLTKAATSPFALLGAAFGGRTDGDTASLAGNSGAPGTAPADEEKRASLARALADRPALRLEVSGRYEPQEDRRALIDAAFVARVRALAREHRRALAGGDDAAVEPGPADERAALAIWYSQAFPERIRALLPTSPAPATSVPAEPPAAEGFLPRLLRLLGGRPPPPATAPASAAEPDTRPLPEPGLLAEILPMDTLAAHLRDTLTVGDDQLRALGQARADDLRAWLSGPGGIDPARILVAPPSSGPPGVVLRLR